MNKLWNRFSTWFYIDQQAPKDDTRGNDGGGLAFEMPPEGTAETLKVTDNGPLISSETRIVRLENSLDASVTLLGEIAHHADAWGRSADRLEQRISHLERMAGVPEVGE